MKKILKFLGLLVILNEKVDNHIISIIVFSSSRKSEIKRRTQKYHVIEDTGELPTVSDDNEISKTKLHTGFDTLPIDSLVDPFTYLSPNFSFIKWE